MLKVESDVSWYAQNSLIRELDYPQFWETSLRGSGFGLTSEYTLKVENRVVCLTTKSSPNCHMDQILVAVDGSKHSFNIVDKGCELAKAFSSSILLVYVMKEYVEEPEGIVAYEKSEGYPDAFSDYLQQLGDKITDQLTEKIKKLASLSASLPLPATWPMKFLMLQM